MTNILLRDLSDERQHGDYTELPDTEGTTTTTLEPRLQRRRRRWRRWRGWILFLIPVMTLTSLTGVLYSIHTTYIHQRLESPFDHTKVLLLWPFYGFSCPNNNVQKDCDMPRIQMLNARPLDQRVESAESWKGLPVQVVNTTAMSQERPECPDPSWRARLFHVYLELFNRTLVTYPTEKDFVFLEDDVVLTNWQGFKRHVCLAREKELLFYSLFKPEHQTQCIYAWGTQAFYVRREQMQKMVDAGTKKDEAVCRLGIDIWISSSGPWYVAMEELVLHHGKRFEEIPVDSS